MFLEPEQQTTQQLRETISRLRSRLAHSSQGGGERMDEEYNPYQLWTKEDWTKYLFLVCIHEAGHVVVALSLGVPVGKVIIDKKVRRCISVPADEEGCTYCKPTIWHTDLLRKTIICAGGFKAEEILNDGKVGIGFDSDYLKFLNSLSGYLRINTVVEDQELDWLMLGLNIAQNETRQRLEDNFQRTTKKIFQFCGGIIRQNQNFVLDIAEALIDKDLDEKDIAKLGKEIKTSSIPELK